MSDNQTSGPLQAPSLFSAGGGAGGPSNARILATLEGRASPRTSASSSDAGHRRPVWLALIGLLLVAAVVFWWQSSGTRPASAPRAAAPLVVAPVNPPMTLSQARREDHPAPQGAAAIIEDERVLPSNDSRVEQAVANPLSALAGQAVDPATRDEAGRLLAMIQADTAASAGAPAARAPAAVRKPVPAPARAAPRAATEVAPSGDQDAALLSALLALGVASPAGAADPIATLAVRSLPGLSLSEQLGECRQLGFLRGEQCRLQVCAGQWGIAPECPTAQPGVTP